MKQSIKRPAINGVPSSAANGITPDRGGLPKIAGVLEDATHGTGRIEEGAKDNQTVLNNPMKYGGGNGQSNNKNGGGGDIGYMPAEKEKGGSA